MTLHFSIKIIFMGLLLYVVGVFFTFLSEFTGKKRSLSEIRKDYKNILKKFTFIYLIFIVASAAYYFLGIKTE